MENRNEFIKSDGESKYMKEREEQVKKQAIDIINKSNSFIIIATGDEKTTCISMANPIDIPNIIDGISRWKEQAKKSMDKIIGD